MVALRSLEEVDRVLGELIDHGYARRLERRPGQKEDRFEQLLGAHGEPGGGGQPAGGAASSAPQAADRLSAPGQRAPAGHAPGFGVEAAAGSLIDRVAALEEELSAMRTELSALYLEVVSLRAPTRAVDDE